MIFFLLKIQFLNKISLKFTFLKAFLCVYFYRSKEKVSFLPEYHIFKIICKETKMEPEKFIYNA